MDLYSIKTLNALLEMSAVVPCYVIASSAASVLEKPIIVPERLKIRMFADHVVAVLVPKRLLKPPSGEESLHVMQT